MAKSMELMCVADSGLGKLTEGQCPVTRTGDYSDVVVVDADGRIIPWRRVARFDVKEMRRTRREIMDKMYTFFLNMGGNGAGGAARSSAKRDVEMGQSQGGCRPEETDGGAGQRCGRERRR